MAYVNSFPIPTIDIRESSLSVRTALGLASPFDLFEFEAPTNLPSTGMARWITTASNTNPAATYPGNVRTTTGYAKTLRFDGTWSAVLGSGTPGSDIALNIPFGGANTVAPRVLHVVSCDASGDYDGDITKLVLGEKLVALDVSRCPGLLNLRCINSGGAGLYELDLSNNPDLVDLDLRQNRLRYLNLAGKSSLETVLIYDNQIDRLILTGCEALTQLNANSNQLTELDVSDCTALVDLNLYNNQLTQLDVTGLADLEILYVGDNQLNSLNLSGATSLQYLDAPNNQLLTIDLSDAANTLQLLYLTNNALETLDLTNCVVLEEFYANDNDLTFLNITGCTLLGYDYYTTVDVSDNQLSAAQLDALYTNLALSDATSGYCYVGGNPGISSDDPSICAANWSVIGS